MRQNSCEYGCTLDGQFFADIDAPDVRDGRIDVHLSVRKSMDTYVLDFHTEGTVTVASDRCLADLELPVDTDNTLYVKLGTDFSEKDDFVTVPEEDGWIDVSWFVYEFVALSLPMKKVHAPGGCDERMIKALNEHICISSPEEVEGWEKDDTEAIPDDGRETDPRWNELKKILNNN